jgi:ATP-dependent exoDNAse (exonuclease V) beta subunit
MFSSGEKRVRDRETGEWRPARFGDVAVLFSRMTHTEPYERELQRAQIPYHVIGGAGFFQREEVTDLLNALQAIETPFDDVAVAGVLRSGLCGLDDNDLTRLGRALRGSWLPALQAAFDGENVPLRRSIEQALTTSRRAALERTVSLLGRLRAAKDALGPARILAELIDGTGFEAQLAGQFEGRRQVGNVRKLEALARSADRSGLNLAAFIEQVRSQALQQQREEQAQVVSENEDVVRLMTIHCAKGLEFPVVVLPDLDAGGGRATPLLACEGWGWVLNASPDDAAAKQASVPLSHALALREDKRRQREEAVRRFYVAVTRHEDFLIFLAPYRRHKELDTLGRPHTPLHWLGQVFSLEAAMRAGRTELPYGPAGEYRLAVRVETGRRPEPLGTPRESPLAKAGLLTAGPESLAETLRCEGSLTDPAGVGDNARLALLGPLGPHIGRGALAVTALNVFRSCPQRFRWEYELRCPAPPAGPGRAPAGVDAAEEGTFYHQCMERLEWDEADPAAAARRAAQEVPLPAGGQPDVLIARLAEMLKTLRESELGGRIASARRRLPEVDFLLEVGPLTLRGQIDLLFQDARGRWAVVDYKSDRVAGGEIADRGGHYRLQLLTYALAAQRHLGEEIAEAGLYFLRPGALWRAECDPGALAGADAKLRELGEALLAARRSGSWPRRDDENCRSCPYAGLCAGLCAARGAPVPPTAGTC